MDTYANFDTIDVSISDGVATIKIGSSDVNVISAHLLRELHRILTDLENDPAAKVIVFESTTPDYFIAHFDFSLIDDMDSFADLAELAPPGLNFAQALGEQIRHQSQVTIVKLRGITRGGGSEFVLAADMCFAAPDARISQCETLMGVIPGGGGTQYLARRIGRNRALEAILCAELFDAETLERYGWINRVIPDHELDAFIDNLAGNIARLPAGSVTAIKRAMPPMDLTAGLVAENKLYFEQFGRSAADYLVRGALAAGAQTPEGERDLEGLFRRLIGEVPELYG